MDAVTTTAQQHGSGEVIIEGGVARLTGSDSRSWTVETEAGQVTATIDQFTPFPGPHPPANEVQVAENTVLNNGDVAGTINMEFAEVDQNGNIVRSICSVSGSLDQGQTGSLNHDPSAGVSCQFSTSSPSTLRDTMPDQFGATVHYGFRVWGADESQPNFPAPAAAGAPQVQPGPQNPIDDVINDIANELDVPPEVVIASGVAVGGLGVGFVIEDQFNIIRG